MSMKKLFTVIMSAAMLFSVCGCQSSPAGSTAAPASAAPAAAPVVSAAAAPAAPKSSSAPKEESGKISLYTSQPEADAQALIEAFNKLHPQITVEVFRSGTEEVVSKVLAEKQANAVLADVMLVSDAATFERLKAEDLLLSYKSPELEGISSGYYDSDNTYTGTKIISTGIIYNTEIIKNAPASLADLAKAEYKDELTMPSPLYSGAAAYNLGVITRTEGLGWDYYQKLKDNNVLVGKGNGGVQKAVAEGEKGLGLLVDYMAVRSKAQGAPVEFVYPSEGSLIVTEPVGIVKQSKNQQAAKLFVDFILSKEGQQVTADIGYTPIKEGVKAPEGLRGAAEITNLTYDIKTLVETREEDKKTFAAMFEG